MGIELRNLVMKRKNIPIRQEERVEPAEKDGRDEGGTRKREIEYLAAAVHDGSAVHGGMAVRDGSAESGGSGAVENGG